MSAPFASLLAETAPRYTSYPTAPHFHVGVTGEIAKGWMSRVAPGERISLYVHIPFCDRLCWFCACHTRHTLRYEPVAAYLKVLYREIETVAAALPSGVAVGAVHFGGGSPTMLTPEDLHRLMGRLRACFRIDDDASISVEIDPSDMDAERLDATGAIGTTRASIGIQDFEPRVQKAINREQSFETTRVVVEGLRARGIAGINLDLVYGLPYQTTASVADTVLRCLTLSPDRLALFGYAHVPWFKKHQTLIPEAALPGPQERLAQAAAAAGIVRDAGYEQIGIDHFALPGDGLAAAQRAGRLRRNFQGYTDDSCTTLIGLGPSSISQYPQGYAQNTPAMGEYRRAVEAGGLPVVRGIALSADDRARAWVIERLMCEFGFETGALSARFAEVSGRMLAEAATLCASAPELLSRIGDRYEVPSAARPFVRSIAAKFDAYLDSARGRHSLAV